MRGKGSRVWVSRMPTYEGNLCESHGCTVECMSMTDSRGILILHDNGLPYHEAVQVTFIPLRLVEDKTYDMWGQHVRPWLEELHALPESASVHVSKADPSSLA